MASEVASAVAGSRDMELVPFSLTGPGMGDRAEAGGVGLTLFEHNSRDEFFSRVSPLDDLIAVDYTHPDAAAENALLYASRRIPFVMGTTGHESGRVAETALRAGVPAVVAPNMAMPIVAITAMLRWAASEFPGVFRGYGLSVRESHQKGKADTSGTAKSLISLLQELGASFNPDNLSMCRNPDEQLEKWGIPREYLTGHAFHTYDMTSLDRTAHFRIEHNILGRRIYAEGTLAAIRFLHGRRDMPLPGRVYDMIDVLKNLEL